MSRKLEETQPHTLKELLENYTVSTLRALADCLTFNPPSRKSELVSLFEENMINPENLQQLWKRLNNQQQAAVAEVVHSSSLQLDMSAYLAKYGRSPDWGPVDSYGSLKKHSLLWLFIYPIDGNGDRLPHYAIMPCDLKKQLREVVSPPRALELHTVDKPPDTVVHKNYEHDTNGEELKKTLEIPIILRMTEHDALHDIHAVLRLIDTGKVRVSAKSKKATTAVMRTVGTVLQRGDFYQADEQSNDWITAPGSIKTFAWPLIVQAAGLAIISGTKLELTREGKKALTAPAHQIIQRAWTSWLKTKLLDELNRVHTIKGQTGKGKRMMTLASGRRAIIKETLCACPTHRWFAFDEFSRFMRALGHRFSVTRALSTLYIQDSYYGNLLSLEGAEWDIVQKRYMLVFLFEYAATMGLIDVAYIHPSEARDDYHDVWILEDLDCLSRYDGLLWIRINGLGAWCLGLTEEYVPTPFEERKALKVLPNLEVVVVEPLPAGDVLFLELFAEQTSDYVWNIERTKLLEALEKGHSVDEILSFLETNSSSVLPHSVLELIRQMGERVSQLVDLGSARLIEVKDAVMAQLLVNDSRLKSLCMLAGEQHIVVLAGSEKAFRRVLRELGYGLSFGHRGS
ncbi:MAG: helicase-associated domain-containing protein [Candidatus Thorarchaeota archaeon]|nr:helicase-associated domain-containing protein [Candidatus Thorarchaeota archaeon]